MATLSSAPPGRGAIETSISLRADHLQLRGCTVDVGRLSMPGARTDTPAVWQLEPLADVEGVLHGTITDAQWVFDAEVAVPVKGGRVDFGDATVEHVGPDSRLGVSRLGVYVDAPDGRRYLYLFATPPASGVTFERRAPLLGAWVAERGALTLQPLAEALLRQAVDTTLHGLTEQARALLGRTSLHGDLRLGDGRISAPGLTARLVGASSGHNVASVDARGAGRAATLALRSLSVVDVDLSLGPSRMRIAALQGAVRLALDAQASPVRVSLHVDDVAVSDLRIDPG